MTDADSKDELQPIFDVVSDEQLLTEAPFVLDEGLELATYDRAAELADLSLLAEVDLMPYDLASIYGNDLIYDEGSLDALVNSTPQRAESDVVAEALTPRKTPPTQPTAQVQPVGTTSSYGLLYRVGLCLTLVLTGQFYILFSKRVASS